MHPRSITGRGLLTRLIPIECWHLRLQTTETTTTDRRTACLGRSITGMLRLVHATRRTTLAIEKEAFYDENILSTTALATAAGIVSMIPVCTARAGGMMHEGLTLSIVPSTRGTAERRAAPRLSRTLSATGSALAMIALAVGHPLLTLVHAVCRPPGPAIARRGRTRSLRIDLVARCLARLIAKSLVVIF